MKLGITRSAAVDYSAKGIRVNVLPPGGIATPMLTGALEGNEPLRKVIEASHPIGRIGQPEEVAEAAAWLLADAASFVTGACLAVDGGFTTT